MAIMARWRMPPDKLERVLVDALLGVGDAHLPSNSMAVLAGASALLTLLMQQDALHDLVADGVHRARRRSWAPGRSWSIASPRMCRISGPSGSAQARFDRPAPSRWRTTIPPSDLAAGCGTMCRIEWAVTLLPQPDSPTRPTSSPSLHVEADAVHRLQHALREVEVGLQVLDRQVTICHFIHRSELLVGVGRVAQAVAQEVEGQHGQRPRTAPASSSQGYCATRAHVLRS